MPFGYVADFFKKAGRKGFREVGGEVFEFMASRMRDNNPGNGKSLAQTGHKEILDHFPEASAVRIYFDAQLYDSFTVLGKTLWRKKDVAGQTFGKRIYVKAAEQKKGGSGFTAQHELLVHELAHYMQYQRAGSLDEFGERYAEGFWDSGFKYAENEMEEEAAFAASCYMKRRSTNVAFHNTWVSNSPWTSGWSTVLPFKRGSQQFVLLYKQSNGAVRVSKLAETGTTAHWSGGGPWLKSISHIVPLAKGSETHLLRYRSSTGWVSIDRVNPNGMGITNVWSDKWSTGWTDIQPFEHGQSTYLLFYKWSTGSVRIGKVLPGFNGTQNVWSGSWTKRTWTSIVPIEVTSGLPYLLVYNGWTGNARIGRFNSGLQGTTNKYSGTWSKGWSNIHPLSRSNQPPILMYKSWALWDGNRGHRPVVPGYRRGQVHVGRMSSGGRGTNNMYCDDWSNYWTHVVPFNVGTKTYVLKVADDARKARIDRIDGV